MDHREITDFIGNFDGNAELARKLDLVIVQIAAGLELPEESMRVLRTASERIRMFVHPESP